MKQVKMALLATTFISSLWFAPPAQAQVQPPSIGKTMSASILAGSIGQPASDLCACNGVFTLNASPP
jgi:hypothetical protein